MYHADPTFNRVLTVFLEQDHASLTPSFIAYELDLTSRAAEQLLDEMVKRSLLDLDFDDNGQLYYTVSADAKFEIEQRREEQRREAASVSRAPQVQAHAPRNDWRQPHGFDGAVGSAAPQAPPRVQQPPYRSRRQPAPDAQSPDGCDGTAGYPSDSWDTDGAAMTLADGPWEPTQPHRPPAHHDGRRRREGESHHHGQDLVRYQQRDLMTHRQADPMVAALLSMLFVGTGQIYNREVGKGLAMFVSCAVLWLFSMGWIVNVWAVVDAYGVAARNRLRNDRMRNDRMPNDRMPNDKARTELT
ncbi:hypothetical protein FIV42_02220 [Persicimonas caeni]|uniref:TM2 domain-containing protein n=1 Tax=Persicimonas caeni TaxID=2292766 RepID=A0A4Y6PP60_PERCE|nr:hypothetical protein [Persicimonas caeni]QDG49595.1 hypothetical protein FIV42_02220 [Persicimonas caeni]QED30816.1 hypothetical protein FRD00_02215 [Persicimonas caeni]